MEEDQATNAGARDETTEVTVRDFGRKLPESKIIFQNYDQAIGWRNNLITHFVTGGLLLALVAIVPASLFLLLLMTANSEKVIDYFQIWLTAIVGFTGSAVGFYFRGSTKGSS